MNTAMIPKSTIQFLKELKQHNDRDWFMKNKPRYTEAHEQFTQFVGDLLKHLVKFDPSLVGVTANQCVFRIYRDVRFSKDKSPYKTHFGAYITSIGKKTDVHGKAGYYLHIEPGASMLAGGAYVPDGTWLKAIRQEIDYNGAEFRKILSGKKFKEYFGELEGEKLTRLPKGYPETHPDIELLKHKSHLAVHNLTDKQVLDNKFLIHCATVFKAMHPLNTFLNRSMD